MPAKFDAKIGGDAQVGAVGDYATIFQLFVQPPEDLASYVRARDFQVIVDDRTRSFVGRDFVFDAVDAIIADRDFPSGYIVIQGEPGIGKTAVLSEFIKRRKCVHHLHSAASGIRSPEAFLSNVCAQLLIKYKIKERMPARATSDSGYLTGLLAAVTANGANRPLIVAIDALDEADRTQGLSLPPTLPKDVYFVVTMREGTDVTLAVDNSKDIFIRETDPRHRQDVASYIDRFVDEHPDSMPARIAGWKVTRGGFSDVLMTKSEGNFMYLVHVLRDINSGLISPATIVNVQKLPNGLVKYYELHWKEMRSQDTTKFTYYQQPVICLLTTVREPVSQPYLVDWMQWLWADLEYQDRMDPAAVKAVIDEWRAFLNVADPDESVPRYRVYHQSLADFVEAKIGTTMYHEAIARRGISKIPSLDGATS